MATMQEQLKALQEDVADIKTAICGPINGSRTGLVARVEALEGVKAGLWQVLLRLLPTAAALTAAGAAIKAAAVAMGVKAGQ